MCPQNRRLSLHQLTCLLPQLSSRGEGMGASSSVNPHFRTWDKRRERSVNKPRSSSSHTSTLASSLGLFLLGGARSALCATAVRFSSKGVAVVFVLFYTFETCSPPAQVCTDKTSHAPAESACQHQQKFRRCWVVLNVFGQKPSQSSAHLVTAVRLRSWS
jgi:hypothetical protein